MKSQLIFCFAVILVFLLEGILTVSASPSTPQESSDKQNPTADAISFRDDIRPILSNHCFQCHGPDEKHRQAGLRLDIENEDIDFDEILMRISSTESFEIMPPPSANKELDPEQIQKLERWIEEGATYEEHWSFVVPKKPNVPANVHPVDFFVDQRLTPEGLTRSPQAEPAILIRRLYLDMTGLPPTIEQANEFINNPTNHTYENIVDRLLGSPEYGERWARRWLDLARYADTNGYEKDRDRSIWPYRDWVIRAINEGMPFDQFSIEQIAGDMLPNATLNQRIATGFHRNTMLNEEGGIDPLEFRYYAMADRVATTGTTWLGLTVGCAQCHTHKFDPITHHNYFGMMAYLDNTDEPDLYIPNDNLERLRQQNENEAVRLLSELANHWPPQGESYDGPTLEQAYQSWLDKEQANDVEWTPLSPKSLSSNSPYLSHESNGIIYAGGDTTKHDVYQIELGAKSDIFSIRLEALPDIRHPDSGPGMTYYEGTKGDFFLSEMIIRDETEKPRKIKSASETYAKNQFGNNAVSATLSIDGDLQTGWSIYGRPGERHVAVFNLEKSIPAGTQFSVEMHFGRHFASSLGKFRLSSTKSQKAIQATNLDLGSLETLSEKDRDTYLRNQFLLQAPQLAKHNKKIHDLRKAKSGDLTLVMQERPQAHTRETYLRHRGEYTSPRHKVRPHLPESLFSGDKRLMPQNRLEFAQWLVSRENPLTARVVANRQWAAFFGVGLVKTLDDFGFQGESPSHPQLLDYLAVELVEKEWSIKQLHRLIVTSQTYRQSSVLEANTKEASRTLLAYFPRKRLEAELIRDSSLMAAGLLNKEMYGRPVRPLQPDGAAVNFSRSTWRPSQGPDRFRRSIYTYQKRTAPFAMSLTFDAPSGESCIARRDSSNTPLQALTLMNDPMFMEIADGYGKRMESVSGNDSDKITMGFRWLLTRNPSEKEMEMLTQFHDQHRNWTALARVLLCLDEAVTKN